MILETENQNIIDVAGCSKARPCSDLVLKLFNDWNLSGKFEMNKLYLDRFAFGGFVGDLCWSSQSFIKKLL